MKPAGSVLLACVVALAPPGAALADSVLTIRSGDTAVELGADRIGAMEAVEIRTATDWTDGVKTFRGPLARDVIAVSGMDVSRLSTIHATAANDYSVAIPASDILDYDVILATEMDGERLTLRDKGPLWIVYPRDAHAELKTPRVDARWIWQLVDLRVE